MSEYPEHDKLRAIREQSQTVGEFLEWLSDQGLLLAKYHVHNDECSRPCGFSDELMGHRESINGMLARFFKIDPNKIETEKSKMLEAIRAGRG